MGVVPMTQIYFFEFDKGYEEDIPFLNEV